MNFTFSDIHRYMNALSCVEIKWNLEMSILTLYTTWMSEKMKFICLH